MNVLVWLRWPEKCFRANAQDIAYLKAILPKRGVKVLEAKSEKSFLAHLNEATHVITWRFDEEWYLKAPHLRLVATPAAGKELVSSLAPKGVNVHFGHFHGDIIAESVLAFMLAWARGFFAVERNGRVSSLSWPRSFVSSRCFLISGTKAVIIGNGKIGSKIGEKLKMLGVESKGYGRANIKAMPKDVNNADWVILALPSSKETNNIIDEKFISLLPKKAVIINIGRGNAIDEKALIKALNKKRIAGAYLDVFKNEPTFKASFDSTAKNGILSKKNLPDNLVCMPHSSACSLEYIKACFTELLNDGMFK
ncbi:MAG: hypothetical protein J6S51_04380 [Kiritimatiellae bacterium]|nr:hypothetical protein [Kiritimatiellia bacterium]